MAETKADRERFQGSLRQSAEVETEKERVIRTILEDKQRRDQEFKFFRNSNLIQYTEAGIAQFIGHREKPEWKKDYQYNVFDHITRDKVYAILSKTAGMFEAEFFNTNKRLARISETISTVLGAFYKDSTKQLKEIEKNKLTMLAALISPKAIWYEGWRYQKRTIRDIVERDENTGEPTKYAEKQIVHYNGPWGELVQVDDFIPGSLRIRDIQEQPRLTWIPKMSIEEFKRKFPTSKYPEAAKVQTYGALLNNDATEYSLRQDLKENEVEVPMFFEKWDDKLTILANGIMLTKPNSPMPFAHKDYPFVWGGFEELSPFFVYDMPLTIKLLDMQDVSNEVLNLTLDMVWRALHEVILVSKGDDINDDAINAGGIVDVKDAKNFNKLEFGSSFGFQAASSVMDRVRSSIESASVDGPSSGQSGGKPVTAREVLVAREAALEIASLFLQNMENMERDKARLRVKNQLDRYKRPVEWQQRVGEELTEEAIPVFREISVRDAKLDGGKRGTVNILITEEPRDGETLNDVNVENSKEMSQTIDISPELIRQIEFDVEIVANSSVKKSKALEVGEARAFLADAVAMPDVLDVKNAAEDYVKKLGKKKSEALASAPANPLAAMFGKGGGADPNKKPQVGETPMPSNNVDALLNAEV